MTAERIDLHTHSLHSDGVLLPGEFVRRAVDKNYKALAITDHCDASNIDTVIPVLVRFAKEQAGYYPITFLAGVEITHVPPELIAKLARRARELGAQIVVVHGETPVEPVIPGTNFAAASCPDVDIVAHPGLIDEATVKAAIENDIYIELSGRGGHGFGNGRVAKIALSLGAKLVVDSDTHEPKDMFGQEFAIRIAACAGLDEAQIQATTVDNPWALVQRCQRRYPL